MKKFALIAIIVGFLFVACGEGNGIDEVKFTSSTNETVSNDVGTLGLVGTSASSSNVNIATVEITTSAKIKITSKAEGSIAITVSDNLDNYAIINVEVSNTGSILIGIITKYEPGNNQTPYNGQIFHLLVDMETQMWIEGEAVTTVASGTIVERRQNDWNSSNNRKMEYYITSGNVVNNKITLSLPAS